MDFDVNSHLKPEGLPVELSFDTSIIRVLIMKEGLSKPLIASTVVMPQPEPQMLDTWTTREKKAKHIREQCVQEAVS